MLHPAEKYLSTGSPGAHLLLHHGDPRGGGRLVHVHGLAGGGGGGGVVPRLLLGVGRVLGLGRRVARLL